MELSAVILTKNNKDIIGSLIDNLSFCDEVVVVDDFSDDGTDIVAKQHGAKVFKRELNENFAKQRNFGLDHCLGEWVIFVDSDENVSDELKKEILRVINNNTISAYQIRRNNQFLGKVLKHGEAGAVELTRLAKKNSGRWERNVHEYWNVKGKTGRLKGYLNHNPYKSLDEFVEKINNYSSMHAKANYKEGKKSSLLKIAFYPGLKFLSNYILKIGFLDGVYGFVFALLMSLHSFLAWSKLWIMQTKIK